MAELESEFEDKLREAVLDDIERKAREELGPQLKRLARENFEAYAAANDYNIEHIWQDAEGPFVERSQNGVSIRIEWPELTALFEWGVDPHTIDGNPFLHFYWAEKDQWIKTESVNWGSETGGIDDARAIHSAMTALRRDLQ